MPPAVAPRPAAAAARAQARGSAGARRADAAATRARTRAEADLAARSAPPSNSGRSGVCGSAPITRSRSSRGFAEAGVPRAVPRPRPAAPARGRRAARRHRQRLASADQARGAARRERELVAAVPAAIRFFEPDVAALRALHGSRPAGSARATRVWRSDADRPSGARSHAERLLDLRPQPIRVGLHRIHRPNRVEQVQCSSTCPVSNGRARGPGRCRLRAAPAAAPRHSRRDRRVPAARAGARAMSANSNSTSPAHAASVTATHARDRHRIEPPA